MMENMPGYITVKEYAALLGISVQAVYKQIRAGRLEYTEITEAGKKVKYIKAASAAAGPEATEAAATAPAGVDPGTSPAPDPVRIALDLLGAQLQEKDKQIERLQADIKEKDAHIREQAAQLAELLRNSQQLQAHAQHLLEQHDAEQPETVIEAQETEEIPPAQEDKPKKRSFWAWLFGE